jgi:hypothetical protein
VHIHPDDFQTIARAVAGDAEALAAAPAILDKVRAAQADDDLIEAARDLYQDDDCEIDDFGVSISESASGTWVSAWVFVPNGDDESDEE